MDNSKNEATFKIINYSTCVMRNVVNSLTSNCNHMIQLLILQVSPADTSIQAEIPSVLFLICQRAPYENGGPLDLSGSMAQRQENLTSFLTAQSSKGKEATKVGISRNIVPMKETTLASSICELVNCTRDFITLKNWIF